MENPCGCGNSNPVPSQSINTNQIQQDQAAPCLATVHQNVCVQARVTVTPDVSLAGPIVARCLEGPSFEVCPGTPRQSCSFTVNHRVCVQIPLTFSANTFIDQERIVCEDDPSPGPCIPATFQCCQFIQAQHALLGTDRFDSLSIQLCGPEGQCSPEGNHININLPGNLPNFQINQGEITSMTCVGGVVTVLAQANINLGGQGGMVPANFTFTFTQETVDPLTVTLNIVATRVASPNDELLNETITLVGPNISFQPCTPPAV